MSPRPREAAPQPVAAAAGRPMTDEEVAQALSGTDSVQARQVPGLGDPDEQGTVVVRVPLDALIRTDHPGLVRALPRASDRNRSDADQRSVVARLLDVMAEVGSIAKNRQVTEGPARYAYRGIEDVQAALQGLLVKHRVLIVPRTLARIDHPERTTRSGTAMYACALHVEFTAHGPAGDSVAWSCWGEGADTGDKGSSKAHSMAYKTAMLEAFCIPTEDADDGDRTSPEVTFSAEQQERARAALAALLKAPDEPALAVVRAAAAREGLLGVPVSVGWASDPVPLGEAFDGQRQVLRNRAQQQQEQATVTAPQPAQPAEEARP